MFNFFGRLFGSEKALESVVEGVKNGFDKLHYGDQEKAEAAAKERTEARGMIVEWMRATQGQNLTRRFIAVSFTLIFFLLLTSGIGTSVASIWVEDPERLKMTSDMIFKYIEEIGDIYMLIIAFYFAAPQMGKIADAFTRRNSTEESKK